MSTETPSTEILERKAAVVRSRLLRTLDQLDRRKHQVVRTADQVEAAARPVTAAVAGTALLFGTGALLLKGLLARRRARRMAKPFNRLALALAPPPPRPGFAAEATRKVAMSLVVMLVTEVAKRGLRSSRADT